ncbi:MAG: dihydroorotate dehydrogenase electron transfer subunit [Lentisphaeria bacterium]|nr:dihydroorotate dehydrogenase electron transfer subunit [Lentisphaeria bacterium]
MKKQLDAPILSNARLQGDYFQIDLQADEMTPLVEPGQFVHVRMPAFGHRILRRPFSIYNADPATGVLSVIYKIVGEGTAHLATLKPGTVLNLLGPLGKGYTPAPVGVTPIIVAGGYGCAATYMLARDSAEPAITLIGGRNVGDLLLVKEFEALGADVRVSTDDGSAGHHGLVTDLLSQALDERVGPVAVSACGPNPMLAAVSRIVLDRELDAEISLDHAMCCGVGACFACVVKVKADNPDGWEYARTCRDGPVFLASQAVWDD